MRNAKKAIYKTVSNKAKQLEVKVSTISKIIYGTLSGNHPQGIVGLLGSSYKPGLYSRDGKRMTNKEIKKYRFVTSLW